MNHNPAFILLSAYLFIFLIGYLYINRQYNNVNKYHMRDTINPMSLPLIEDNDKYIELQTKHWIKQRLANKPFFGALEKDKIIMTKWIKAFKIATPTIRYSEYHDNYYKNDLKQLLQTHSDLRLVAKVSHLQNNFGIIIIEPLDSIAEDKQAKYIDDIDNKIKNLFTTCFVCNHDKNDPPTQEEIEKGEKTSYYKLYETIKPGLIIQDFFYSFSKASVNKPFEIKVAVFADKIIDVVGFTFLDTKRLSLVFKEARKISALLGAHLIRTDFFVKYDDNPYVPYLNEISLSPNRNSYITDKEVNNYRNQIQYYREGKYDYINKLISEVPYRDNEIKKYLSDADSRKEKFTF